MFSRLKLIPVILLFSINALFAAEITYDAANKAIIFDGIVENTDIDKINLIYNNPFKPVNKIFMNSDGGEFYTAMDIGTFIFKNNIETYAWKGCYSACAYMWLSGKRRYIDSGKTDVKIHSPALFLQYQDHTKLIIVPEEVVPDYSWFLGYIGAPKSLVDDIWLNSKENNNEVFTLISPSYNIRYDTFNLDDYPKYFKETK